MSNCNRHSPQSMMGLGSCAACAFDAMQGRISELEDECRSLSELNREIDGKLAELERQPTAQVFIAEAEGHLREIVEFAYQNGFHELGYDPVSAVMATAQQVEDARRFNLIEKKARRVQWTGCGFEWEFFTECSRNDEMLSAAIDAALQAGKEKE